MKSFSIKLQKINIVNVKSFSVCVTHHDTILYNTLHEYDVPVYNKHDELFGTFHVIFYKKIFMFDKKIGFIEIRNSVLDDNAVLICDIIDINYMNTYITINSKYKIIGNAEIIVGLNTINPKRISTFDLNIFANILSNNKIFFLGSLIVPLVQGSTTCQLKCLKGLYILIRMYLNSRHNKIKLTKAIKLLDEKVSEKQVLDKLPDSRSIEMLNENITDNNKNQTKLEEHTSDPYENKYKLRNLDFYERIYVYYYFAIATYSSPIVLFNVSPQVKIVNVRNNASAEFQDVYMPTDKNTLNNILSGTIPTVKMSNISETRARILSYLNIRDSDLLEIKLHENTPHIKFVHKNKLIVSFRGTESANDILSDISCDYVEFMDGYVHRGIFNLAKTFVEQNENIINRWRKRTNINHVVFVGHSLGGAIACLVAILLHIRKYNCQISVMSFSPPPFLSLNLSFRFDFVRIFILGNDIFPRLSYGSVLDFKYLTAAIGSADDLIKENDAQKLSSFVKEIKTFLKKSNYHPKLFLPGKIYHTMAKKSCLHVSKVDRREFDSIIVDANFFKDHMPNIFIKRLKHTILYINGKSKIRKKHRSK